MKTFVSNNSHYLAITGIIVFMAAGLMAASPVTLADISRWF